VIIDGVIRKQGDVLRSVDVPDSIESTVSKTSRTVELKEVAKRVVALSRVVDERKKRVANAAISREALCRAYT
jgi:hypothetical protein